MEREQRIDAGAIIIQEGKILLVRYKSDSGDGTYLVGPGGGVLSNEGLHQTIIREVREETGLEVQPCRILAVEDLLIRNYRLVKIWFLCKLIGGQLERTTGAITEGIIEAAWYQRDQLTNEVVYPSFIVDHSWDEFFRDMWEAIYLELRDADS